MAQPRMFTKTIEGQTITQYAYTPADAVRLRFDGWAEQPSAEQPTQLAAQQPTQDEAAPPTPPLPAETPADRAGARKAGDKSKTDTSTGGTEPAAAA